MASLIGLDQAPIKFLGRVPGKKHIANNLKLSSCSLNKTGQMSHFEEKFLKCSLILNIETSQLTNLFCGKAQSVQEHRPALHRRCSSSSQQLLP